MEVVVDYDIKCDEELNTPDVIERNELRARITVNYVEFTLDNEMLKGQEQIFESRSGGIWHTRITQNDVP